MHNEQNGSEATPLGWPRQSDIVDFWARAVAAGSDDPEAPVPEAGAFGDTAELADELLSLVLDGSKRATAGAAADYEESRRPLPEVGDRWIVTDGSLRPRAVLETTDVRVGPLSSVDKQFAWDEGEGDRTRDGWLDARTAYFAKALGRIGVEFHPDIPVVFERFEIWYQED